MPSPSRPLGPVSMNASDVAPHAADGSSSSSVLANLSAQVTEPLMDAANRTLRNVTEWASVKGQNATAKGWKKAKMHTQQTTQQSSWRTGSSTAAAAFARGDRQGRTSLLSLSLIHFLGWVLLFATLTMATVVGMNWYMRRRQAAEETNEDAEEMPAARQQGGTTTQPLLPAGAAVEAIGSSGPSQTSLRGEGGNSSRQRFLEARRAAAQKGYGATETPEQV